MKYYLFILFILGSVTLSAQNERKVIRQGMKKYQAGNFSDAEVQFRKAGDINQGSFEAGYNTGAAMYKQEKYKETFKQFESLVDNAADSETKAHVWYNIGNSLLEAGEYAQSIEAYKNSLRLNPTDQETKYNLAYAKKKLQEQNQQNQNQQNQDQQNQDQQNQDQQNQEQQNQDQQNQEQQNQDQQNQEQQNQEQQNQEQKNQEQEQKSKPLEISKEDSERMLNAIEQQEKEVMEKVDKKKAAVAKVKTEKDW